MGLWFDAFRPKPLCVCIRLLNWNDVICLNWMLQMCQSSNSTCRHAQKKNKKKPEEMWCLLLLQRVKSTPHDRVRNFQFVCISFILFPFDWWCWFACVGWRFSILIDFSSFDFYVHFIWSASVYDVFFSFFLYLNIISSLCLSFLV